MVWSPTPPNQPTRTHALAHISSCVPCLQSAPYPGLVTDLETMNSVVAALGREYEVTYSRHGEIDERDFLTVDFSRWWEWGAGGTLFY